MGATEGRDSAAGATGLVEGLGPETYHKLIHRVLVESCQIPQAWNRPEGRIRPFSGVSRSSPIPVDAQPAWPSHSHKLPITDIGGPFTRNLFRFPAVSRRRGHTGPNIGLNNRPVLYRLGPRWTKCTASYTSILPSRCTYADLSIGCR